jgi:T5SS/PEP-CTERM-associated repeat protein
VPDCGQCCQYPWEADINNGGTAQISTGTAQACETFLGKDNSGQSGNLSVDHATLDQCGDIFVGYVGKGTLSITNGGIVHAKFGASIAAQAGSSGSATVDGTKWTVTVDGAGLNVGGTNGLGFNR